MNGLSEITNMKYLEFFYICVEVVHLTDTDRMVSFMETSGPFIIVIFKKDEK